MLGSGDTIALSLNSNIDQGYEGVNLLDLDDIINSAPVVDDPEPALTDSADTEVEVEGNSLEDLDDLLK